MVCTTGRAFCQTHDTAIAHWAKFPALQSTFAQDTLSIRRAMTCICTNALQTTHITLSTMGKAEHPCHSAREMQHLHRQPKTALQQAKVVAKGGTCFLAGSLWDTQYPSRQPSQLFGQDARNAAALPQLQQEQCAKQRSQRYRKLVLGLSARLSTLCHASCLAPKTANTGTMIPAMRCNRKVNTRKCTMRQCIESLKKRGLR